MPTPLDPRLIYKISAAVAKAAMDSGVARRQISNWKEYVNSLKKIGSKLIDPKKEI